jgi:UDP-N-acetylmuramoyl-tripeptide--D-alanyl-D-alanine ligase
VKGWEAQRLADAAGAQLVRAPDGGGRSGAEAHDAGGPSGRGPIGVSIDTRTLRAGELFVGLPGENLDGGSHAEQALRAGAWGVLVAPEHALAARDTVAGGAVIAHPQPLSALQTLARSWRAELRTRGAKVVAITGSTGKTSTKDILAALLGTQLRTTATPANFNTEVGLPLAVLAAPPDVQALVLEMAMRGLGQIAELTAIAEPDVGVIVNVGPAHLELLGSIERIAAAKAELIMGLSPGATVVVPAGEALLRPYLREDVRTVTFGEGGDVSLLRREQDGTVRIDRAGTEIVLRPSFDQAHQLSNLLAAVGAAGALGVTPQGELEVTFSDMRGQRSTVANGVVVIDDCYNANPMSMRAAIDDLVGNAPGRTVAVLGDMLELGPDAPRLHGEIGEHLSRRGVSLLVGVGSLAGEIARGFGGEATVLPDAAAAAEALPGIVRAGDTVLVKGSRGVGLELVVSALRTGERTHALAHGGPAGRR